MKRDKDLIRGILLMIEERNDVPPNTMKVEDFLDVCDNPMIISVHLDLLRDAGYLKLRELPKQGKYKRFEVIGITFAGYEYIDSVRSPTIWRNVKEKLSLVGGASLDIVKEVAIEEAKRMLNI